MSWVEIHDDILGPKLRGLRDTMKATEATTIGILAILWLWASKNADSDGVLKNTTREDVANAIRNHVGDKADVNKIVESLIVCGWIDEVDGTLSIHDWSFWQSEALQLSGRRKSDRERQSRFRSRAKEAAEAKKAEKQQREEEKKRKKAEKPQKIKFAEAVTLLQSEYDKLVEQHGEAFTKECITDLNNYKMSSGHTYASDYHAILKWVIDDVKKSKKPDRKKLDSLQNESIDIEDLKRLMEPY